MKVSGGYSDLWKAIIRPSRDQYHISDLGPSIFRIGKRTFRRTDNDIKNNRGELLRCSHFEPTDTERVAEQLPCVIYMHGNSSSRLESIQPASLLLPQNITVFAFDFSGCGQSQGEYVTLGWKEKEDLQCVIDFLRSSNKVSLIGLWGRSMGAVTSILHTSRDPTIAGMVLDSPFSNLNNLSIELVKTHTKIPVFVASLAQKFIRRTILSKCGMDINQMNPIEYVSKCFIPALFSVAKGDDFVRPHHGELLFEKYAGDKNLIKVEGDHNSDRPRFMMDSVSIFFFNVLQCDELPLLDESKLIEKQYLLRLDDVLDQQHHQEVEEQVQNEVKDEDEEYKRAVLDSLHFAQIQKVKEKLMSKFFYHTELWKDKENFQEVFDREMKDLLPYIDQNEKDALTQMVFNKQSPIVSNNVEVIQEKQEQVLEEEEKQEEDIPISKESVQEEFEIFRKTFFDPEELKDFIQKDHHQKPNSDKVQEQKDSSYEESDEELEEGEIKISQEQLEKGEFKILDGKNVESDLRSSSISLSQSESNNDDSFKQFELQQDNEQLSSLNRVAEQDFTRTAFGERDINREKPIVFEIQQEKNIQYDENKNDLQWSIIQENGNKKKNKIQQVAKMSDIKIKQQLHKEIIVPEGYVITDLPKRDKTLSYFKTISMQAHNHLQGRTFAGGKQLEDKILNTAKDEIRSRTQIGFNFTGPKYLKAVQNLNEQLPKIQQSKQDSIQKQSQESRAQSQSQGGLRKYNSVGNLQQKIIDSRPISRESQIDKVLSLTKGNGFYSTQKLTQATQEDENQHGLEQEEKSDNFKIFYPLRGGNQGQQALSQVSKYHINPETGEGFYINQEEFMKNTAKSPFQRSVRDRTNYFFKYQDEVERYLDTKTAPQKTLNRRMKMKNSYMTIFPMYGLNNIQETFHTQAFASIGTKLEKAEMIDYTYYNKQDYTKKYTEEMLKAKNMRMNKK